MMDTWTDYDTHARTRPRDDFWGQVRRTVHGQPVTEAQVGMIVGAAADLLALQAGDRLLDLACGNGALSRPLFDQCAGGVGVDVSEYLIGVAREHFAGPSHSYVVADAADHAEAADPTGVTKVLCYGSFSYFTDGAATRMLRALDRRFPALQRVLLGNLPDPARAGAFYPPNAVPDLRQPRSPIGAWRGPDELANLAGPGWQVWMHEMQPEFFAAHYRYDALLVRL
jgi:SAM-dependent methyltransferase